MRSCARVCADDGPRRNPESLGQGTRNGPTGGFNVVECYTTSLDTLSITYVDRSDSAHFGPPKENQAVGGHPLGDPHRSPVPIRVYPLERRVSRWNASNDESMA